MTYTILRDTPEVHQLNKTTKIYICIHICVETFEA